MYLQIFLKLHFYLNLKKETQFWHKHLISIVKHGGERANNLDYELLCIPENIVKYKISCLTAELYGK